MYYSTYRRTTLVGLLLVAAVLGLLLALVSVGLGVVTAVLIVACGLIGYEIQVTLLDDRLDEYHGRFPMPTYGLWGLDIIDDRDSNPRRALGSWLGRGYRVRHRLCPKCQTLVSSKEGATCPNCGSPLPAS